MTRAIIDTNFLIRIITNDVPDKKAKALSLLADFGERDVLFPEAVLAEVVFVLHSKHNYNLTRHEVFAGVGAVLLMPQLAYDAKLFHRTMQVYRDTKLDFVDCLVLAQVKLDRAETLLSFDAPLMKALQS